MLSIHSTSVELEGVHTDIMVQGFADRILVLVTQMGKVGNLVHIQHLHLVQLLTKGVKDSSIYPIDDAALVSSRR
jgi:hypothetical protein